MRWPVFKTGLMKGVLMKTVKGKFSNTGMLLAVIVVASAVLVTPLIASAACLPGEVPAFPGADVCILDPLSINKYELPLVIPPVMNNSASANTYDIAVRQFKQQILPGGIWKALGLTLQDLPATTVWSYGPAGDTVPAIAPDAGSQFNYPAYTIETTSMVPVDVRWINDLVDGTGAPLPHLLSVDQTLHWANPGLTPCMDPAKTKDCTTLDPNPYTGAVPIVTHVHGAHVEPHSDGYPEAWWLPAGMDPGTYESSGSLFSDASGPGVNPGDLGYADYNYVQTQPATTLWYHDHALGMTRLNVYAGPAGFWLIRGGAYDAPTVGVGGPAAVLPGPAPVAGDTVLELNAPGVGGAVDKRSGIREIPIVIQDRSFKGNGDLFYPEARAFFEGLNEAGGTPPTLDIPFVPGSDIAPIWNPEAFFSTMVVNGVVWPQLEVAPALYRFRLLNGCNSRFLNLSLQKLHKKKPGKLTGKLPFFQVGSDQGFLPQVVRINTGESTPLPGTGAIPANVPATFGKDQALLMGLAERADVIVDFRGLGDGTTIRMFNTAPDAPFGGFPDIPADPATTGQVMQFVVNTALLGASPTDPMVPGPVPGVLVPNPNAATDPYSLVPSVEPTGPPPTPTAPVRTLSLNEEESGTLCVDVDAAGNIFEVPGVSPHSLDPVTGAPCYDPTAGPVGMVIGVPMAPKAALLGTFDPATGISTPLLWSQPMTERPLQGDTEMWELYNLTVDGHPMHLHLVRFEVMGRQTLDPLTLAPMGAVRPPEPWEAGFKDTVIAYPGEVTRLKATFDIAGLYVWHCHIVEHEDNEMMRPYCVDFPDGSNACGDVP
jgi:FtsP/CotA-like multicopper oxidase with cupredoxin domain